jgi:predicted nucleotidyltransferase
MTREEFFEKIAAHRAELDSMGIKSIGVFGSVARNQARPDSDVDVLVEFNRPIGLLGSPASNAACPNCSVFASI